jgi:hypothetical protein
LELLQHAKKVLCSTLNVLLEDLSLLRIKLGGKVLYVAFDECNKLLLVESRLFLQVEAMVITRQSRKQEKNNK